MNKEIVKNEKELVIARLDAMPENTKLSLGSLGTFSKEELIDRVNHSHLCSVFRTYVLNSVHINKPF